jgi:cytochrome c553
MKKILFAVLFFGTTVVYAAETPQTELKKTALCASCHGQRGISNNPQWPNLAGQHAGYLSKQLHDFKKGTTRQAVTMAAIIANLSDNEIAELADFYAKQTPMTGATPEKYLKRGEQLYRGGDFAKHLAACIACHGPKGLGNAQANFPAVSGQHATYTLQQLRLFKAQKRENDCNSIMRDISARMSEEDMEAVAYYIQGLH